MLQKLKQIIKYTWVVFQDHFLYTKKISKSIDLNIIGTNNIYFYQQKHKIPLAF